jgi:hypothetical protein
MSLSRSSCRILVSVRFTSSRSERHICIKNSRYQQVLNKYSTNIKDHLCINMKDQLCVVAAGGGGGAEEEEEDAGCEGGVALA